MIRLSPALLLIALSGCAATNANVQGEWDCPAQQGRACTTIEEADTLSSRSSVSPAAVSVMPLPPVMSGSSTDTLVSDLPTSESRDTGASSATGETEMAALLEGAAQVSSADDIFPVKTPPVRQAEILGKVWFYPFVDNTDHYHEGGFVHVVLRPADWQTSPEHMFPNEGSVE